MNLEYVPMVAKNTAVAWVRIGAGDTGRWPEWRRRWLVCADGRVFVPVPHTPATADGAVAVRDNAPHMHHAGHVYVDAVWLLERRTGDEAASLRDMVERVAARPGRR